MDQMNLPLSQCTRKVLPAPPVPRGTPVMMDCVPAPAPVITLKEDNQEDNQEDYQEDSQEDSQEDYQEKNLGLTQIVVHSVKWMIV